MQMIPGIKIGHYTDLQAVTGCTVILCEEGAVAGVDVRGSAPGTRETDLLRPLNLVQTVNAVLLSGGSAFGLAAASGVMRYLEERKSGYRTSLAIVPIVPAAVLYDLDIGDPQIRPGPEQGYAACLAATDSDIPEGNVGAGTGASVGKILGISRAVKSGLGIASEEIAPGIKVCAVMAVNAVGHVFDPASGKILAGTRDESGRSFLDAFTLLKKQNLDWFNRPSSNTTLGTVITNARLNKEQINKVAQMAQDGIARTIDPCHTMYDGDTIFALSLGKEAADVNLVGVSAARMVSAAILRSISTARSLGGLPAASDLK